MVKVVVDINLDLEPVNTDRETLGRLVRETWVSWACEQRDPKPSWLVSWDRLEESDKEVDRRIGAAIRDYVLEHLLVTHRR